MLSPRFFWPRLAVRLALAVWLLSSVARGHDPFESTVVSRLQHGRLEVTVTMTMQMGSVMISDPAKVEDQARELTAQTLEQNRELLEERARSLYEVVDGDVALRAQKASVRTAPEGDHLEIVLIYPAPVTWPLHLRVRPVAQVPSSYRVAVDVVDQDDNVLGRKLMNPRDPTTTDLTVQSATTIIPSATPAWMAPVAAPALAPSSPTAPWPWVEISAAVLVGGAALGLATRLFKKSQGTTR